MRTTAAAAFGATILDSVPEDTADRQPFFDGRYLLVADARVDNRAELLSSLGPEVRDPRECSDAEILFHAWRRWREHCVDRIVGDYAFAVHDQANGELFLIRDPIGQRPLFYSRQGDAWCFASMPSGLLAYGRRDIDRLRVAERLAARENLSRRSYFTGIQRLLSGEKLKLSADRVTASRWSPRTDPFEGRSRDDLVAEMRHTFDQAVSARLRRMDGPIATQLSSGYDSSAVTATATWLSKGDPPIAFTSAPSRDLPTVAIRGRIADESAIAAQTARILGIEHEIVRPAGRLLDSLRHHTRYFQEPVRNVLNMDWWAEIERHAAARGCTVLLTGEAGNLTVNAGGLTALADWVRRRDWRSWWREASSASRRSDVRWRGILMNSFRMHLPRRLNEEIIRAFLGQPRWSSACFVRPEVLASLPEETVKRSTGQADERLQILHGFDAGVFRKGSLAKYGVDERDPTADRRVIELSLRMPPEQLLERGTYKPLARELWSDRLPPMVLDAPLRGYQGADWASRLDRNDALATLEEISGNGIVQDVFDLPRLAKAIRGWPHSTDRRSGGIEAFGRHVTNALAMGVFLVEADDQAALGI